MTIKLEHLTLPELTELYLHTSNQFIAALNNDTPLEGLQHLRDCLTDIRAEIARREIQKETG